jgi:hypothetical protein
MAQYKTKIKLYLEANSKTWDKDKVSLQNNSDGKGNFIASWTYDGLDKPTDSQLASYETAGNTEEANSTVKSTRKKLYGNIGDQLDEIYKDIDAWKARIKKIKDDNPKE